MRQGGAAMIDKLTIFEIHRLNHLGWSFRKIARTLGIDRDTVKNYINDPQRKFKRNATPNLKLDPFRPLIQKWLEQDKEVKAPVVLQRLRENGFDGQITIVRDYLRHLRGRQKKRQAFLRFESLPGEQMQIDWGHFGSLLYGETKRKLYALAVLEAHSRMLYVEFTHSQNQSALHQCLLNAFIFFGGSPKEILVDNMLTAVIERQGNVVRFNDAFLDFLRIFNITPIACSPGAPNEKGKVESAIKYLRQNFWPLRSFGDLTDVQLQVQKWLKDVANVRTHHSTGQRPVDRFEKVRLNPLPQLLPDCRQVISLKVHKDFAVRFDTNAYTVPPWTIGQKLTVKADAATVTVYHKHKKVACHPRCWQRKQRIESPAHTQQVKKIRKRLWQDRQIAALASLGLEARYYLKAIIEANLPIKKNVARLLSLNDQYGTTMLTWAIRKALSFNAYGAEYIENILYQNSSPKKNHPPVRLKDDQLNTITLTQPCLADYDAHILKKDKSHD
jgi:transposase